VLDDEVEVVEEVVDVDVEDVDDPDDDESPLLDGLSVLLDDERLSVR